MAKLGPDNSDNITIYYSRLYSKTQYTLGIYSGFVPAVT